MPIDRERRAESCPRPRGPVGRAAPIATRTRAASRRCAVRRIEPLAGLERPAPRSARPATFVHGQTPAIRPIRLFRSTGSAREFGRTCQMGSTRRRMIAVESVGVETSGRGRSRASRASLEAIATESRRTMAAAYNGTATARATATATARATAEGRRRRCWPTASRRRTSRPSRACSAASCSTTTSCTTIVPILKRRGLLPRRASDRSTGRSATSTTWARRSTRSPWPTS